MLDKINKRLYNKDTNKGKEFEKMLKMYFIKKMIREINPEIRVKRGKALQCDIENKTIYIAFKTNKIDSRTFERYVYELNEKCKYNTLLLGILHEVGHIYTYNEKDEEDYYRDNEILSLLFQSDKIDAVQFNEFYLRLPLESKATQWAIDFSMLNKKFCRYYENKIGKEIIKNGKKRK